ncbi:MAG TPA: 16S rRNA (cytosine(1402)-N(4))-methyltransferase RsmH [Gemmatimonadaceae bacterium]|nr:16S rRNA (cytosine(1402)-N(4))-methyltransferase RsmH [Gemmatimonadaceae bacterium]
MSATAPTADVRPPDGRWDTAYHAPVLVDEVLETLAGAKLVLDCTLGGGGHSAAILETGASVTGLDRDPAAVAAACERLRPDTDARFQAHVGNYAAISELPQLRDRTFDGILLDLGVSSHQIDAAARGFSFRDGAPLDMRMGADALSDAATLLNTMEEQELAWIFREYGDEPRAFRLAREVTRRRSTRPFVISDDLVGAIRAVLGPRSGAPDFARLFQAVRIAVNDELAGLERALPDLRDRLNPGGVLTVIAYHSGEDRIVKHAMRDWSQACTCPPLLPRCACGGKAVGTVMTKRAIRPGAGESARNPRARSARLRGWRKAA